MSAKFPTAKLIDIAELNPTLRKKLPAEELVSFVPMASLSAESASVETTQDRPYAEVAKGFTPFLDGDVLVAKITPCFENGKIAQARLPRSHGFGSTEFHVVRARSEVAESRYLHHYLRLEEVRANGQRRMTGSGGQRRVPASFLADLAIPLPPLEEQRRIAAILDQAETLRTQRRTALARLDSLTQSLFLDMFGDPVANPKGWSKVPLTQTCASPDDIRCGPFGTQLLRSEFKTEGVPLWGIKNVNAKFEIPTHEFVDEQTAKRLSQYSIEPLDIVMTRKGTVGNCAVYPTNFPSGVMHSDLLRLRVSSKVCLSTFLSHQLHHSQDVERQLTLISGGAVMPGINVSRLKELLVFLPPLPLQQTFATRIASIEALQATHRRALAALDALFASLQQRAFAGQL